MIDLSTHLNEKVIKNGRLKLLTGTVTQIDINDNSLDLVTAFETVQFWPNIVDAFSEIFRILDNEGEFLIINRFPKEGTKWWKMANLKSEDEYMTKLEATGFKNISIDLEFKRNWIVVKALKS